MPRHRSDALPQLAQQLEDDSWKMVGVCRAAGASLARVHLQRECARARSVRVFSQHSWRLLWAGAQLAARACGRLHGRGIPHAGAALDAYPVLGASSGGQQLA
eukprot:4968034-Prymnesium_polylepis.1